MFGMGTSLVIDDFKRILVYPKAVTIGFFGQIFLLPLIGYLFASSFGLSPENSVGIMVLVACAGGATSNIIVYLAKGDVALSVTLTSISSLVTFITIPFVVNFALYEFMNLNEGAALPISGTSFRLFLITLLPVIAGMYIRLKFSDAVIKLEKTFNHLASILFILIVIGILFKERSGLAESILSAGPVAYALNFTTMLLGFSISRLFKLSEQQSVTVSVEVGVQNSATGIFIATSLLNNSAIAAMPLVYSFVMYLNAGLLIGFMQFCMKEKKEANSSSSACL